MADHDAGLRTRGSRREQFVLYRQSVFRLLLRAVFVILLADASGLMAFVSPEMCTSVTDTVPDGKCPALCVRCGCCAQPTVAAVAAPVATTEVVAIVSIPYVRFLTSGAPHDILHVPK